MILQLSFPDKNGIQYHTGGTKNRTLIIDTFNDGGEEFVKSIYCLELQQGYAVPLYLSINHAKGWMQSQLGSEIGVKLENTNLN
jgi:hypothetical protein